MKEKENEKDNLIKSQNENEIDNNESNLNEKSSDIEQINNIENMNNSYNQSQNSLISEDSNNKLKKIFGKYNSKIESLIYTNPPNKEDVFLVLIFTGTLNFVQKNITIAKRKRTYIEEDNNKEKDEIELEETKDEKGIKEKIENEEEMSYINLVNMYQNENDKKKFKTIFNNKMEQTHNYISSIKNAFKELDKTEDKLIEKIIFYYGQIISEKIKKENVEYYNICSEEFDLYKEENKYKIDKSLYRYYYELSFEDFILIFSSIVNYFTGLEIKLELKDSTSKDVYLLLYCEGEETYEKLADFFGYELQLKPYALNYKETSERDKKYGDKKLIKSDSDISLGYTKTIDINKISDLKLPSLLYEFEFKEKEFKFSPPYKEFDINKETKFRRYLPNDESHLCKNDPDFSRELEPNECHKHCSKFRSIDKFRLIHQSLDHIMTISHLYKNGLLKMIINKRNNVVYHDLNIFYLFFNLIKFGFGDYLKTINTLRNFFGESVAFYFLWIYYFSLWSLPPIIIGIFLYFMPILKNQRQETMEKILNFLDNYDLPSIIFGLLVLVCTWMFLKSWAQKEKIFRYLWGVEKEEKVNSISEYFIPDKIENFILGETIMEASYYTRLKKIISGLIIILLIIIRIYLDYLIYNPNLLKDKQITNFINKFQIWIPLVIKIISLCNNYISNILSIWENHETKSKQQTSYAWKLILLEFFNYYTTLVRVAIVNNYDYQQQMRNTIYIFLALDVGTSILEFLIQLIRYFYRNGTLSTKYRGNKKKNISSTLEHQIYSQEIKNIISYMNKRMIRFGYLCIFSAQASLTPIIIFLVNLIETFFELYKLFYLYRVEIIEKARGIGVYNSIIQTLFFVGMLLNVILVFFHQNERENFVIVIFIIVVFENLLFFINLLNINTFLPFWYLNLNEIKSLYDKKYYSRETSVFTRLNSDFQKEEF